MEQGDTIPSETQSDEEGEDDDDDDDDDRHPDLIKAEGFT